jgi:hypothetical protein
LGVWLIAEQAEGCGGGGGGGGPKGTTTPKPEDEDKDDNDEQDNQQDDQGEEPPDLSDPSEESEDIPSGDPKKPAGGGGGGGDGSPEDEDDEDTPEDEDEDTPEEEDEDTPEYEDDGGSSGDEVEEPSELDCKAEDLDNCFWANEETGDTLNYKKGTGIKEEVIVYAQQTEGIDLTEYKDESYIFVGASKDVDGSEQTAWYKSGTIPCADSGLTLKLGKAAAFGDAKLNLCTVSGGSSGPLENCAEVEVDGGKGEAELEFDDEFLEDFQLVIETTGLKGPGLAAFDDISVDYETDKCPEKSTDAPETTEETTEVPADGETTESPTGEEDEGTQSPTGEDEATDSPTDETPEGEPTDAPPPTDETAEDPTAPGGPVDQENCAAVKCDDESCDMPKSETPPGLEPAHIPWETHTPNDVGAATSPIHNPITGVEQEGKNYRGTYTLAGQGATQATNDFDLQAERTLTFEVFERTDDMQVFLCYDKEASDCPYESTKETHEHRGWSKHEAKIKKGTKKLYWIVKNTGTNQGATGIRNLQWAEDVGEDGAKGLSVCQSPAKIRKQRIQFKRLKQLKARKAKAMAIRNRNKVNRLRNLKKKARKQRRKQKQ